MTVVFSQLFFAALSQEKKDAEEKAYSSLNVGVGLGIDYGGIGGRVTFLPIRQAFLFGSLGYNFDGVGYNVGAGFRILPNKRACPYLIAMYGYNAVSLVLINGEFQKEYIKTFYGPSAGLGLELRGRNNAKNYLNIELLYLMRSQKFKDYRKQLEDDLGAEFFLLPVSFSIGYHIGL